MAATKAELAHERLQEPWSFLDDVVDGSFEFGSRELSAVKQCQHQLQTTVNPRFFRTSRRASHACRRIIDFVKFTASTKDVRNRRDVEPLRHTAHLFFG